MLELHGDDAVRPTAAAVIKDSDVDTSTDSDTDGLDKHVETVTNLMRKDKSANIWQCTLCEYSSKRKCNVSEHAQSKHIRAGYDCHVCNKTCPSPSALRMHRKRKHNE